MPQPVCWYVQLPTKNKGTNGPTNQQLLPEFEHFSRDHTFNCMYLKIGVGVLETKEWRDGQFMAVQWRTETSTGNNLRRCYETHVRSSVEKRRKALGFGKRQVFFNTDLVGQASTTYNVSVSPSGHKIAAPAVRRAPSTQPLADRRLAATRMLMLLLEGVVAAVVSAGRIPARCRHYVQRVTRLPCLPF